jgi:hypothetical protein
MWHLNCTFKVKKLKMERKLAENEQIKNIIEVCCVGGLEKILWIDAIRKY